MRENTPESGTDTPPDAAPLNRRERRHGKSADKVSDQIHAHARRGAVVNNKQFSRRRSG